MPQVGDAVLQALNDFIEVSCDDTGSVGVVITTNAGWVGTLTFQGSGDGVHYPTIGMNNVNTHTETQTFSTANTTVTLRTPAAGYAFVRITVTAYTSGTATVEIRSSSGTSVVELAAGQNRIGSVEASAGGFADGAITTLGTNADAAVGDATGTLNAHARQIAKSLASSLPLPTGAATETTQLLGLTITDFDSKTGALTETAPATDTASSGLNGRLQRIAQRITSLIGLFPTALGGTTAANSFAVTLATDGQFVTSTGSVTETAPTTDTASSGLNGRLQRIAQRLTSLIALLPSALVSGRLDVNLGAAPATVSANSTLQAGTANAGNTGGITVTVNATLTRPANTTAYTAGDEMTDTGGAILTLTNIASASGKSGVITHIAISVSTNAAIRPDLTLFFYDTTSTPQTDNAAFAPSDAVGDTCIGYVRVTDYSTGDATSNTGNLIMDSGPISLPFITVGSANLFLRVKLNNAYTAGANSDTYKFRVKAEQNL